MGRTAAVYVRAGPVLHRDGVLLVLLLLVVVVIVLLPLPGCRFSGVVVGVVEAWRSSVAG